MHEILRLAIPALVAGIAEPLIGLADTAIVGQVGTSELGAVGLGASFYTFIIWVLSQTRSAVSAIISRALGTGSLEQAKGLVPQAVFSNFLLGFGVILITLPFTKEIFSFYNATGEQLEQCQEYYNIRAWGFPLTLATWLIFGAFRGLQNTSWAMIIALTGGVANLLLDLLLVFGVEGIIPPMGIAGAAWASLIAQAIMFLLAVYLLNSKTPFGIIPSLTPSPYLKQLMGMSANLFIRTLALNVAYFLSNRFAASYGEEYIGAHTIAMQIWLFSAFFIDGFASAGNAISGKLLGENDMQSLRTLARTLTRISLLIAVLLSGIYAAGYFLTADLFTDDVQVIVAFNAIYWLVIVCQPLNAVAFTYDGIFKGLGETAFLRNTLLAAALLAFVPCVYWLDSLGYRLHGVWIAFLIFMVVRAVALWWRFRAKYC